MNKKAIIWGVVIVGVAVGGYFVYRNIVTTSNNPEKNTRRIKIKRNKNVSASQLEEQGSQDNQDIEL
jgi:hypothetical protein